MTLQGLLCVLAAATVVLIVHIKEEEKNDDPDNAIIALIKYISNTTVA